MKIGIVNDLPLVLEALRQTITRNNDHQVLWVARDGAQAVRMCRDQTPDLILMDLLMPVMDGVQATREIMAYTPCPILVVTSSIEVNASLVFEAMGAGALDAINTPMVDGPLFGNGREDLLRKISLIGHLTRKTTLATGPTTIIPGPPRPHDQTLIAVGASSGGPHALAEMLGGLPGDFPAPLVIVQHVDRKFVSELAKWLSTMTPLPISLAQHGMPPRPGNVYIACSNDHLAMNANNTFTYTKEPRDLVYRPSVDVFFNSIVQHWQGHAIGILLTGMGNDGAQGLLRMKQHGWYTITQDRQSSAVFGMPKAAAELNAASEILPLSVLGRRLTQLLQKNRVAVR